MFFFFFKPRRTSLRVCFYCRLETMWETWHRKSSRLHDLALVQTDIPRTTCMCECGCTCRLYTPSPRYANCFNSSSPAPAYIKRQLSSHSLFLLLSSLYSVSLNISYVHTNIYVFYCVTMGRELHRENGAVLFPRSYNKASLKLVAQRDLSLRWISSSFAFLFLSFSHDNASNEVLNFFSQKKSMLQHATDSKSNQLARNNAENIFFLERF